MRHGRPAGGFSHEPLAPVQVVGEVLPVERGSQSVVSTVYWPGTVDDVRTHHEIPPPADRAELEDDVRAQPVDVVLRCVELKTEVLRPRGELAREPALEVHRDRPSTDRERQQLTTLLSP